MFLGRKRHAREKRETDRHISKQPVAWFRCGRTSPPPLFLVETKEKKKKEKKNFSRARQVSRSAALLPALISWAGTKCFMSLSIGNRVLSSSLSIWTHKSKANSPPPPSPLSISCPSLYSKMLWCLLLLTYANKPPRRPPSFPPECPKRKFQR